MATSSTATRKVAVSLDDGVLRIELLGLDPYEAQVLFDDVAQRLLAGEGVSLDINRPRRRRPVESGQE